MKGKSTEDDKKIGHRLKMIRKDLGLTQEELAVLWGVTFQQVQKYESGANRLSASKLFQFVNHFNLNISAFDVSCMDDETSLFLSKYRKLDIDKREMLMDFIKTLSKKKKR